MLDGIWNHLLGKGEMEWRSLCRKFGLSVQDQDKMLQQIIKDDRFVIIPISMALFVVGIADLA